MNRYLKDPIILISIAAWIFSLIIFVVKMSDPTQKTSAQASQNPPPQAVTAPVPVPVPAAAAAAASTASVAVAPVPPPVTSIILKPIVRHVPGKIMVGMDPSSDTSDLRAAINQVTQDEKIYLQSGTFHLDEYPRLQGLEHISIIGVGDQSVIKLHSTGVTVHGNTRLENLTLEGPIGSTSLWVENNGIATLKGVVIRESAFGVHLDSTSKLYGDNLKFEKIDSYCVTLASTAKAEISDSSFSDCFTGMNITNLSHVDVRSSKFRNMTFAFDVKDDRNHAQCSNCTFESVQNIANDEKRVSGIEPRGKP